MPENRINGVKLEHSNDYEWSALDSGTLESNIAEITVKLFGATYLYQNHAIIAEFIKAIKRRFNGLASIRSMFQQMDINDITIVSMHFSDGTYYPDKKLQKIFIGYYNFHNGLDDIDDPMDL